MARGLWPGAPGAPEGTGRKEPRAAGAAPASRPPPLVPLLPWHPSLLPWYPSCPGTPPLGDPNSAHPLGSRRPTARYRRWELRDGSSAGWMGLGESSAPGQAVLGSHRRCPVQGNPQTLFKGPLPGTGRRRFWVSHGRRMKLSPPSTTPAPDRAPGLLSLLWFSRGWFVPSDPLEFLST